MEFKNALFWHRRDIRIADNSGLHRALIESDAVIPVFIFDTFILDKLQKKDARVSFLHREIYQLKKAYQELGSDLIVAYGDPKLLIPKLAEEYKTKCVYTNRDYEPYARSRDSYLYSKLKENNILTRDQLADLSSYELIEILTELDSKKADDIIIESRQHWFKD